MRAYMLEHVSDRDLLRDLAALVAQDRTTTTALLAHIAVVDVRRLYVPAAHPSMYSYCVGELHMSEDAACKRIRAARAARQFPAIFGAVAEGRLHLSAVVMLAPHLTPENATELMAAAAHKSRSEIEHFLAERYPRPDVPARIQAISSPSILGVEQQAPEALGRSAPGRIESSVPSRVAPLSPQRFALQVTVGQSTYEKLQYARALLGHQLPTEDLAAVLDRALDALIRQLEKRKFAATSRPRPRAQRATTGRRHVPADVRRTVWQRDGGQCTFVSEAGHRCLARTRLEYDHIDPVARGGQATVERMRLRCRAHNQYEAERTFGTGFMSEKREEARRASEARQRAAAAEAPARAAIQEQTQDVLAGLRELGFRADEARRAAESCATIPVATLEQRMRAALKFLGPKPRYQGRIGTTVAMPT